MKLACKVAKLNIDIFYCVVVTKFTKKLSFYCSAFNFF